MKKQLLIAAVALLTVACKKNDPIKTDALPDNTRLSATAVDINPANSSNPFDYAGLLHNKALHYSLSQQTMIRDSSLVTISKIMAPYAVDSLHLSLPGNVITVASMIMADGENGFKNAIKQSSLSPAGRQYLRYILSVTADTLTSDSGADFMRAKAKFVEVENAILADKELSDQERTSLLQGASVARYSMMYWLYIDTMSQQPAGLSIFKKLFVVAHDVVGTVLMGIGGGAYLSDAARAFITKDYKFFVPDYSGD